MRRSLSLTQWDILLLCLCSWFIYCLESSVCSSCANCNGGFPLVCVYHVTTAWAIIRTCRLKTRIKLRLLQSSHQEKRHPRKKESLQRRTKQRQKQYETSFVFTLVMHFLSIFIVLYGFSSLSPHPSSLHPSPVILYCFFFFSISFNSFFLFSTILQYFTSSYLSCLAPWFLATSPTDGAEQGGGGGGDGEEKKRSLSFYLTLAVFSS